MLKFFSRLAIILLLGFLIYSAATIISTKVQLDKSDKEIAEAVEKYTAPASVPADSEEGEDGPEYAPITVNFEYFKRTNEDVVGWLYCEDPQISIPVLQTNNNTFYLKHSFSGRKSSVGAPFVDSRNRFGFEDANTIVFGRKMTYGSMFSFLENWNSQEYYDSHRELYLLTPDGDYRVEIIAAYTVPANSNTFTVIYKTGRDMEGYLERIMERSAIDTDVEADPNSKYILLSTYAGRRDSERNVLHGKLIPLDTVGGVIPAPETEEEGQEGT